MLRILQCDIHHHVITWSHHHVLWDACSHRVFAAFLPLCALLPLHCHPRQSARATCCQECMVLKDGPALPTSMQSKLHMQCCCASFFVQSCWRFLRRQNVNALVLMSTPEWCSSCIYSKGGTLNCEQPRALLPLQGRPTGAPAPAPPPHRRSAASTGRPRRTT